MWWGRDWEERRDRKLQLECKEINKTHLYFLSDYSVILGANHGPMTAFPYADPLL